MLLFATSAWSSPTIQPPPAYRTAAMAAGVPPTLLFAIALQESGLTYAGRLIPWPWTLNIAGIAHRFHRQREACNALLSALRSISPYRADVGLAQINVGYHGHRVDHPCALLNPRVNLRVAAQILLEQQRPEDDWLAAAGRYHRPAGGEPAERYKSALVGHLARIRE